MLGANNLDVAKTYYMLACLYSMQKKYELSLETYGKCLAIRIAVLGENHLAVLHINACIALDEHHKANPSWSERVNQFGGRATHAMDEFDKLIANPLQFGGLP